MRFRSLGKVLSQKAWSKLLHAHVDRKRAGKLRLQVEALYGQMVPLGSNGAAKVVIADGLWDNPNHFMRLRIFLEALGELEEYRLIGILHRHDDPTRSTLQALGFHDFVCIEEDAYAFDAFLPAARSLLAVVHNHADFLNLPLPNGLPAYTYYDTVLKIARHPQPPLDSPLWERVLTETLRNLAIYGCILDTSPVSHIVLSHPWKSELASLIWLGLERGIPAYHLTAYCEGIRIKRFWCQDDYKTPVEHLPVAEYAILPMSCKTALHDYGLHYMQDRECGTSTDVNARYAFRPDLRHGNASDARACLGGAVNRPLVVVYCHVWYDFPHTFGMRNFTDFRDWMQYTIDVIREEKNVDWVLKPHPTEKWYGGFGLTSLLGDLPSNIWLAPEATDSLTAMLAADAIVTVHGTIALEAAAHGLPVICGDRSYYSDWGFVHLSQSRDDYARLLRTVASLPRPADNQRFDAVCCLALALAPTPTEVGVIELRCDSSGSILYDDILKRQENQREVLDRERFCIRRWLEGTAPSYSVDLKLQHFSSGDSESARGGSKAGHISSLCDTDLGLFK